VSNEDLKNLEGRIDALIDACQKLKSEKSSLEQEKGTLSEEHIQLMEKTRQARSRIEGMIARLKTLERG